MPKRSGFTLIELLVVISIIGILSAVGMTVYSGTVGSARDAKRKADIDKIATAYETSFNIKQAKYRKLEIRDFSNGVEPTPPEGGRYLGWLAGEASDFTICAKLEGYTGTCPTTGENTDRKCYCRPSVQGQPAIASAPTGGGGGGGTLPSPPPSSPPTASPTPSPPIQVSPAFRGSTINWSSTHSQREKTFSLDTPSSSPQSQVQQNDLMLVYIFVKYLDPLENDPFEPILTPPPNWTLLHKLGISPLDASYIYWKIAGSNEPERYIWSVSSYHAFEFGVMLAYSGVNVASPIDVSDGQTSFETTSHSTPSVVTTTNNTIIVTFFGIKRATSSGVITLTVPTGMNERETTTDIASYYVISVADIAQPTAGSTGAKTAISSLLAYGTAQIVVIK